MTLILTTGNAWGIHQSSDYRLTDVLTGQPSQSDEAGAKQLSTHNRNYTAQLSFTGIASIGAYKTRDWIGKVIGTVPVESDPESLARELAVAGSALLAKIPQQHRRLTIVLAAVTSDKGMGLFVISNFDNPSGPAPNETLPTLQVHDGAMQPLSFFRRKKKKK